MNRFLAIAILCSVVLVTSASTVSAAPSFKGYTGLVKIPKCRHPEPRWVECWSHDRGRQRIRRQ